MIRTTAVPRSVRIGFAAVGVAGALALAGCTSSGAAADSESAAPDSGATSGTYVDGTYSAEGSYATPESVETLEVTVTLEGGIITDVEVTGDPQKSESAQFQGQFIGGIADVVDGKNIDEISVDRVAGSSLTSSGFNQAIEAIKSEAAA